jgi:adenylosuccinate synthase
MIRRNEVKSKKMDVLVDLQFGSTGKGALAGFLSTREGYDAVISCNMPNAGHTAFSPNGKRFMHKVLPSGLFSGKKMIVGIGPGAVFSIGQLLAEWANVTNYRADLTLIIHDAAGILLEKHAEAERATLSRISSTMQGSSEALIAKIRREEGATARYHAQEIVDLLSEHGDVHVVEQGRWLDIFSGCASILLEGSQGYSLGLSSGFYPYCTSRECTPARVISDCGLPVAWLRKVYGSCRVHPIRVGNTPDGFSGDWYMDQQEIHFSDLGVPEELTTVTKRVRRIATFSYLQIRQAMMMAMPDEVFLNFVNYSSKDAAEAREDIEEVAIELNCGGVTLMGHGPKPQDIEEL